MYLFSEFQSFFRANFHCHTTESDGKPDPEACISFYKTRDTTSSPSLIIGR